MSLAQETADSGFVVELERFQGPLDLLLHLIREQDIDIFDIPIADITAQFLEAVENVEALGLERAGEFLEMAATLIRIKVQMLLPRRDDEGLLEDPRAELVRRLLEYEHFREAAHRLEDSEADRLRHFARGYAPPRGRAQPARPLETTWDDVWLAALGLAGRARPPVDHRVAARAVPLEDKLSLIRSLLGRLKRVEFRKLIEPFRDRLHAIMTLLAGLELARQRELRIRQREPFASLWFYRRNGGHRHEEHPDH